MLTSNNNPHDSSSNRSNSSSISNMTSSCDIKMWTDASLSPCNTFGGAAFTFEQVPDHWAGQWRVVRNPQGDVRLAELLAIKDALDFLVASTRRVLLENPTFGTALPAVRTVDIVTDCLDAVHELNLFSQGGDPRYRTVRVTEVIHKDLLLEIARIHNEAERLSVRVSIQWNKKDSSHGNQVADHKAGLGWRRGESNSGRGARVDSEVFLGESFYTAANLMEAE